MDHRVLLVLLLHLGMANDSYHVHAQYQTFIHNQAHEETLRENESDGQNVQQQSDGYESLGVQSYFH